MSETQNRQEMPHDALPARNKSARCSARNHRFLSPFAPIILQFGADLRHRRFWRENKIAPSPIIAGLEAILSLHTLRHFCCAEQFFLYLARGCRRGVRARGRREGSRASRPAGPRSPLPARTPREPARPHRPRPGPAPHLGPGSGLVGGPHEGGQRHGPGPPWRGRRAGAPQTPRAGPRVPQAPAGA